MNNMITMEKNKLICVFKNKNDTSKYLLGYIITEDDKYALFQNVSFDGENEGISLFKKEDVFLIEEDNKCINGISNYCMRCFDFQDCNNVFDSLLDYLKSSEKIVQIELNNSYLVDVRGRIICVGEKWIEVIVVLENGEEDGKAYCKKNNITMIDYIE